MKLGMGCASSVRISEERGDSRAERCQSPRAGDEHSTGQEAQKGLGNRIFLEPEKRREVRLGLHIHLAVEPAINVNLESREPDGESDSRRFKSGADGNAVVSPAERSSDAVESRLEGSPNDSNSEALGMAPTEECTNSLSHGEGPEGGLMARAPSSTSLDGTAVDTTMESLNMSQSNEVLSAKDAISNTDYDNVFYPFTGGPQRPEFGAPFNPHGAPLPSNEALRMKVLQRYNLLDTAPEPKFDRLTALAAQMFNTPVALVSLVDEQRQYFKSNHGLGNVCETPRSESFCAFTLLPSRNPCLVVEDARKDTRFCENKLVAGSPFIQFYAGAPLLTSGGFILGSLCIIDFIPRKFSGQEQELLLSLAHLVVMELEKHTQLMELQREQAVRFEADKQGLLRAIDAFSEGLVLVDTAQKGQPIVFVNEGWEKITGYSSAEVQGLHCGSFLQGPLTEVSAVATLKAAVMEGRAASVEILNYRKDGTPFWNWLRIRPVLSASGISSLASRNNRECESSGRYYFGILSDCTSRKEKEMQLERIRLEELEKEAATRAKRQFVANISHEIRTPMNAIIACSQLLQDKNLEPEQLELVQMIAGSGQQLLSLINDILDFSKLEAGKMDLQVKEFSIWNCLDFCMEMLVLKSQTMGLDLSYNVDPSVPHWIWADEVRLRQILTNLLSNAAKFTEEGGEVEVAVKARPKPRRGSFDHEDDEYLMCLQSSGQTAPLFEIEFSVRDTGIGMPKDFCNVIFEAFTQCDNSRTRKYEGTGLGMAIAKELTRLMGGRIWVESEVGKGSTFYFTVIARGSMQERKATSTAVAEVVEAMKVPRTPLTGKRCLLVGASGTFQRMVGSMVRSWGMHCTVVQNPGELELVWGDLPRPFRRFSSKASTSPKTVLSLEGGQEAVPPLGKDGSYPFDVLLVDCPTTSIDKPVREQDMGSFMMQHETALAMMQMGCAFGPLLPTFLFLANHAKCQTGVDVSKLENVTVLSRPVRVKQVYKSLMDTLAKDEVARMAAEVASLPQSSTQDENMSILIAEDNIVNQRVLLKLLKGLGYENCLTAVNGAKVLEHMRKKRVDLILMDVQMPEMDGLTATACLRAEFPDAEQPVITALTADVGPGIESECQEVGMNWYLSKPVRKPELEALLQKCQDLLQHPAKKAGAYKRWLKK